VAGAAAPSFWGPIGALSPRQPGAPRLPLWDERFANGRPLPDSREPAGHRAYSGGTDRRFRPDLSRSRRDRVAPKEGRPGLRAPDKPPRQVDP
jgi:hypothetical protein